MARIRVTGRGRRWLERGHPWLYQNDVESSDAEAGDAVVVEAPDGRVLGHGFFSAGSKIAARLVTRRSEPPDDEFFAARARRAVAFREQRGFLDPTGACRLLAGDAEGFPGLVIDRYADALVVQCGTQAADRLRDAWISLFERELAFPIRTLVDRSESAVRRFEGLASRTEVVRGDARPLEVRDGALRYEVDLLGGHKTGHYLDQRENRQRAALEARGARVLDAFCYDGLFGVHAALAGASSVVCVDQAEAALQRARANAERNGVLAKLSFERADVMRDLRERVVRGERYELVVLDPPAFAKNKNELDGAERGYRELNLRGFNLCTDGGRLVSASCSYAVRPELFVEWLARAAADSGREAWLEELRGASADHRHRITLPESEYLKCAFVRVGGAA